MKAFLRAKSASRFDFEHDQYGKIRHHLPAVTSAAWGVPGGAVSENGRLRQGAEGHPRDDRRRSVLMLTTLCRGVVVVNVSGAGASENSLYVSYARQVQRQCRHPS